MAMPVASHSEECESFGDIKVPRVMSVARHFEGDHAKVCESVDNKSATPEEADHAKVRVIVDEGLAQLKQWLDLRLQQQEDNLRSLLIAQRSQKRHRIFEMEPQVTDPKQAIKPDIVTSIPSSIPRSDTPRMSDQHVSDGLNSTIHQQRRARVQDLTREPGTPPSADPKQIWISSLMDIFDTLDVKGTGSIDLSEFEIAIKATGFSEMQALAVFDSMDEFKNGNIDRLEWLHMISKSASGSEKEMALVRDFLSQLAHLHHSHGSIGEAGRAKRVRMIIRHDSVWRVMWDVMLIALLFWVAVSLPFTLGFGSSKAMDDSELAVDIFFCCDVLLNFRTSYVDNHDTIVVDWKKIGIRYLKSWFFLDLFSSFPFDVLTGLLPNLTPARLLKISKVVKVLKFLRITKIMSMKADSDWLERLKIRLASPSISRLLRMVKLLWIAFLVSHWLTCFNKTVDSSAFDEYFSALGQAPTVLQQYLAGMYWAMTTISTVGYGDITPISDQERAYAMLAMVIGGSLYGYVVGCVTSIVTDMDVHANVYNDRMQVLQSWLDCRRRIPLMLRRRLRKHFKHAFLARTAISDDSVVDQLSGELRGDAAFYLVDENVRLHPMVVDLPNSALAELVYVLQETSANRHEFVVQVADPGIGMYFLVDGLARYDEGFKWQPPGAKDTRNRFQHITTSESFGEEIIFGLAETYQYTVITIVDCKFCFIDEDRFQRHFINLPDLRDQMYAAVAPLHISTQAITTSSSENKMPQTSSM